jgi:hypothetical protein
MTDGTLFSTTSGILPLVEYPVWFENMTRQTPEPVVPRDPKDIQPGWVIVGLKQDLAAMNLAASEVASQPLEACSVPIELVFGHASSSIHY